MKKLHKKLSLVISIALCFVVITGCSNSNKSTNDTPNNTKTDNETTNNTPDQSKSGDNKTADSEKNKTIDNSEKENKQDSLLKNIKTLAEEGKIINSNFADNTSNISDVENKLGKADKSEWVTDAKGNYSTYSKYNVVFGSNKGGRIFEIRSFDSSLKDISLSNVEKYFGTPDHNTSFNGEKILGYVAGADYKILFVFKAGVDSNDDPKLDHYSVLYPKGTVNSMAGDSGREW